MYSKYLVYLDDGKDIYKLAVPAVSKEAAKAWCFGNGEVIAVKDVTSEFHIMPEKVYDALKVAGFNDLEVDFMYRALRDIGIID